MRDKQNTVSPKDGTTAPCVTHASYARWEEGVWCRWRQGVTGDG